MTFKPKPHGSRTWSRGRRWWRVLVSVVVAIGFIVGLGVWAKKRKKK